MSIDSKFCFGVLQTAISYENKVLPLCKRHLQYLPHSYYSFRAHIPMHISEKGEQ